MSNQKNPCHCPASTTVSTADSQSSKNSQLVSNNNESLNKTENLAKNDSQIQAVPCKTNNNNVSLEKGKSSDGQDCTKMFEDKTCLKTIKEKFAEFYALEYQKHLKQENQDNMAHRKEEKDNNYSRQEKLQNDKEQSDKGEQLKCDDQKYLKQEIQQCNQQKKTEKEVPSKDSNYCDKNQQSDELETLICSCLEKLKRDKKQLEQDSQKMLLEKSETKIPSQSKSLCSQTKIDHDIHKVPKCNVQEKYNDKQDRFRCPPDEECNQIQKYNKVKENESNISTQNKSQPCKQQSQKLEPLKCDDEQKTGSNQNIAKSNKPQLCKQQSEKREPLKSGDMEKVGSHQNVAKLNESQPCKQQSKKGIPLKSDDKEKIGSNQTNAKSNDNCIKECMRKISSTISKTYKGVEGCLSSTKSPDPKSKSAASITGKSKCSKSSTSTKSSYSYKSAECSDSEDNLATKKYLPPNNKNIIVSRAQQKFYDFEEKPVKKCKSKDTGKCIIA